MKMVYLFHLQCNSLLTYFADVVRAMSEAIKLVSKGKHDPMKAHERVKSFYSWNTIAKRTEVVYRKVHSLPELSLWDRLQK